MLGWLSGKIALGPLFTCNHPGEAQHEGYLVVPPQDRSAMGVNVALRFIGVSRGDAYDEFAAVDLDRYRWTDEWVVFARSAARIKPEPTEPQGGSR